MNKTYQKHIFNYFYKNKIRDFIGVPDSTLKEFIQSAITKKKIIITTKEEEAIGLAVGISLSGFTPLVFMQNAGFANSLSTITSLVEMYNVPIIFLIGWRGYEKNDAPEHLKIGKIQPTLLDSIGLKSKIVTEKNWKYCCDWALKNSKKQSCALIVRRLTNG
jgi:sulfopyruvate decarboxylase TPP-binding subunit